MKGLVAGFFLLVSTVTFAQTPDPRDSIILESKTVPRGGYPFGDFDTAAYLYIRVWITNKDSLNEIVLSLVQKSIAGEARVVLGQSFLDGGMYSRLTNTLGGIIHYDCFSRPCWTSDTFFVRGISTGNSVTIEPPNLSRKPFWDIKFDAVLNGPGVAELDTGWSWLGGETKFRNTANQQLPVNFVKSVITVMPKGDLNLDGILSLDDVVELVNCIFLQDVPASGLYSCDLNCDGRRSGADVLWELYAVFMGQAFPC